jgi:2-polyprenyl-3-methyl-5-hydroxy-6-metoxy-1,4-benzoquinol methylase
MVAVDMIESAANITPPRYVGDRIAIRGDYQLRAISEGIAPQRFWHEAKVREAQRWIDPRAGDVILDVGCGSGVLAARLAGVAGTRVIGVDGNRAAIEFASGHHRLPNLEFRHGLVDELPIEAGSIDKIAFLEVIEHIHSQQGLAVLRCFHRILKPGGRAVISTPNVRSLWPLIEWLMDTFRLAPQMADEQHVAFYDEKSLRDLGESAGLRPLAHRTINFAAPWLAAFSWRMAEAAHRLETIRSQPLGSLLMMTFEKPGSEDA